MEYVGKYNINDHPELESLMDHELKPYHLRHILEPVIPCMAWRWEWSDDYGAWKFHLLKEAANTKPAFKVVKGKRVYEKPIPVYLQSVANISNQYQSIYNDAEELVKILVTRCKTLNAEEKKE